MRRTGQGRARGLCGRGPGTPPLLACPREPPRRRAPERGRSGTSSPRARGPATLHPPPSGFLPTVPARHLPDPAIQPSAREDAVSPARRRLCPPGGRRSDPFSARRELLPRPAAVRTSTPSFGVRALSSDSSPRAPEGRDVYLPEAVFSQFLEMANFTGGGGRVGKACGGESCRTRAREVGGGVRSAPWWGSWAPAPAV